MSSADNSSGQGANISGSSGLASDKTTPANAGVGAPKPGIFDKGGAIGGAFTEQGAIGGTAQKIGGPLDKDGAIGKQFTEQGSIGGTVQEKLGRTK